MSVILFVDMLGCRQRWQDGGVKESVKAFKEFEAAVARAIKATKSAGFLEGAIESDSAMLVFGDAPSALRVAENLYLEVFNATRNENSPRMWIRGCLVPRKGNTLLRAETATSTLATLKKHKYSSAALQAISVEKCGFKGMRMLVCNTLVKKKVKKAFEIEFGTKKMERIQNLKFSVPRNKPGKGYSDFLWMATADDKKWNKLNESMSNRIRYSVDSNEELNQAVATRIVFDQVEIIKTLLATERKEKRKRSKAKKGAV
jgi:hypothetical protein